MGVPVPCVPVKTPPSTVSSRKMGIFSKIGNAHLRGGTKWFVTNVEGTDSSKVGIEDGQCLSSINMGYLSKIRSKIGK